MINLSYHLEWKKCGSNKQMITSKILGQRTWKCVMKYVFAGAPCISLLLPRNHEKCYMAAASVVHWISMCPAPTFSHLLAFGKWTVDLALWTKANGLRAALVCSLWAEAFEPMQDPQVLHRLPWVSCNMMEPQGRRIGYILKTHA